MQADKLRVATLTANYNNGKYFDEWLGAIQKQTRLPDLSVIVDDGSQDNSVDVIARRLESISNKVLSNANIGDGQVRAYTVGPTTFVLFAMNKNKGPATARNVGLKFLLDKSDVICVADSDDIFYPEKLAKSVKVLLKYPQIALVYSDYDTFNDKTGIVTREFKEPYTYRRLFEECIVSNNSAIATSVIGQTGLYDEDLFGPEDYDLWLRIGEVAGIYHIPESLYKYRISGSNLTITTPSDKFAQHVRRVHEKAAQRRNKNIVK